MITAVLAHFLLEGEKLRLTFFIGFGSALIGLLLITFNGNIVLRLNPLGDIMAAGAALVFGGYSIFMKKLSAYEHHIIELTQRVFLYGLLFMVPALFLFDFHFDLSRFSSASNILNMLFLGIGASACASPLGIIQSACSEPSNPVLIYTWSRLSQSPPPS